MDKQLTIRWIGQGGYLLCDGKTSLCIDPYLSDAVNRVAGRPRMVAPPFPPSELKCDAVICTHDHLDHVDIDAIPQFCQNGMRFYAPTHAENTLRTCGVSDYAPFDEGRVYRIGGFEIEAVYAHHSVPAIGVLVRHGTYTLYFSGDTEYHEKLEALARHRIDVMVICINGKLGNMNVQEAIRLTTLLRPALAIPTHYGMFAGNTADPRAFTERLTSACALDYNKEYSVKELLKYV